MKDMISRLDRAVRFATQDRFFEGLIVIVTLSSIGLGLLFLVVPNVLAAAEAFQVAFSWMAPQLWGAFFILSSLVLMLTAIPRRTRQDGMWPGFILGVTYLGIATAFLHGAWRGGVPTGILIYLMAGLICMWVVAGCALYVYDPKGSQGAQTRAVAHHP